MRSWTQQGRWFLLTSRVVFLYADADSDNWEELRALSFDTSSYQKSCKCKTVAGLYLHHRIFLFSRLPCCALCYPKAFIECQWPPATRQQLPLLLLVVLLSFSFFFFQKKNTGGRFFFPSWPGDIECLHTSLGPFRRLSSSSHSELLKRLDIYKKEMLVHSRSSQKGMRR